MTDAAMASNTSIIDMLNLPICRFHEVCLAIRAVLEARNKRK